MKEAIAKGHILRALLEIYKGKRKSKDKERLGKRIEKLTTEIEQLIT